MEDGEVGEAGFHAAGFSLHEVLNFTASEGRISVKLPGPASFQAQQEVWLFGAQARSIGK